MEHAAVDQRSRSQRLWPLIVVACVAVAAVVASVTLAIALARVEDRVSALERNQRAIGNSVSDLRDDFETQLNSARADLSSLESDVSNLELDISGLERRVEEGFDCEDGNWGEYIDSANAGRGGRYDVSC